MGWLVLFTGAVSFLLGYFTRWYGAAVSTRVLFNLLILLHKHSTKLPRKDVINILDNFSDGVITTKKVTATSLYIYKKKHLNVIKQP